MKYKPHNYQQYAIDFIRQNPTAAIFLDMGMGKTSLTLMAILYLMFDSFEIGKVLIVAPLRVARHTWPDEIEKWDDFHIMRYSVAVGSEKERIFALRKDADIYIINRENIPWLVEKSGLPFDYDMIVIDELSSFKNSQAKRFKSLMKVRPNAKRIVGLTGTPTGSGGYMDLFAEFKLLDMGERLGRFIGKYRLNYFRPLATNGQIVYSYGLLPGADEVINRKISDVTISMRAVDHLDMPELISTEYPVYMSDEEKQLYDNMKKDLILQVSDDEVTAANAAVLSGKLTQMANGAIYGDDGDIIHIHDRKLDALEDIIEAANGKPILIAYWYKHDLERIRKRIDDVGVKYAEISSAESIRMWNKGECPVGLIHPASAGHGLNLQSGGSTLVWFGLTWSLELYKQTIARLWRQGQSSGTVVVQHIVAKKIIDERILKALSEKDHTQAALIEAVRADITEV